MSRAFDRAMDEVARTDAAKRFKKTGNATATISRLLLVAEKNFRKIAAAPGRRGLSGRRVRGMSEVHEAESEDRRLMPMTHLLTQALAQRCSWGVNFRMRREADLEAEG